MHLFSFCLFVPTLYTSASSDVVACAYWAHTQISGEWARERASSWLLCRVLKHTGRVSSPGVAPATVKKSLICVLKSFRRSARSHSGAQYCRCVWCDLRCDSKNWRLLPDAVFAALLAGAGQNTHVLQSPMTWLCMLIKPQSSVVVGFFNQWKKGFS